MTFKFPAIDTADRADGKGLVWDDGDQVHKYATVGASPILQVVTASLTATDVNTTAATFQDSGLQATITPLAGDSLLIITVMGECRADRVAGTIADRYMWVAIRNDTDAVMLTEQVRGRTLASASANQIAGFWPIALEAFYTVDDTDPRTFKLQYKASEATNARAYILTATPRNVATMVIMEIAA